VKLEWQYSHNNIDWSELSILYKKAPLGDKDPVSLQKVFSNSMFKCFVFDGEKLIGVGRALADGCDCSYICDVAILPDYQGAGLGNKIIQKLVSLSKGHKKIILYSAPGTEGFYKKVGFSRMTTAMAIFEDEQYAFDIGLISEN